MCAGMLARSPQRLCETTGHKPPVKAQTTDPQLLVQAINGSQVPDADPVTGEVRVDS